MQNATQMHGGIKYQYPSFFSFLYMQNTCSFFLPFLLGGCIFSFRFQKPEVKWCVVHTKKTTINDKSICHFDMFHFRINCIICSDLGIHFASHFMTPTQKRIYLNSLPRTFFPLVVSCQMYIVGVIFSYQGAWSFSQCNIFLSGRQKAKSLAVNCRGLQMCIKRALRW